MAFTETERVQIRLYLGWSGRFYQFDSRLEQAMNAVSAETEVIVKAALAECQSFDEQIQAAPKRFKAAQVGSITLQGATELALLRSCGRAHVGRIAATLGVEVKHDVFSGAAPGQSNWLSIC
jgi:hypothetical protein